MIRVGCGRQGDRERQEYGRTTGRGDERERTFWLNKASSVSVSEDVVSYKGLVTTLQDNGTALQRRDYHVPSMSPPPPPHLLSSNIQFSRLPAALTVSLCYCHGFKSQIQPWFCSSSPGFSSNFLSKGYRSKWVDLLLEEQTNVLVDLCSI